LYPTSSLPLTTLREFSMYQFMNAVTDRKNWETKVSLSSAFPSDTADFPQGL
jgi:hypothetical protein